MYEKGKGLFIESIVVKKKKNYYLAMIDSFKDQS
jgi:hypothetical protein